MLEMLNLSDDSFSTRNLLQGNTTKAEKLWQKNGLDGLELLCCEQWNPELFPAL